MDNLTKTLFPNLRSTKVKHDGSNLTESRKAYILDQEKMVKSKSSSIDTVKFPIATVLKGTFSF